MRRAKLKIVRDGAVALAETLRTLDFVAVELADCRRCEWSGIARCVAERASALRAEATLHILCTRVRASEQREEADKDSIHNHGNHSVSIPRLQNDFPLASALSGRVAPSGGEDRTG
jgi:hypothetical protein